MVCHLVCHLHNLYCQVITYFFINYSDIKGGGMITIMVIFQMVGFSVCHFIVYLMYGPSHWILVDNISWHKLSFSIYCSTHWILPDKIFRHWGRFYLPWWKTSPQDIILNTGHWTWTLKSGHESYDICNMTQKQEYRT